MAANCFVWFPYNITPSECARAFMRVVYLHGFSSSPRSTKASFFRSKFEQCGVAFDAPDLAEDGFERLSITGQLRTIERVAGDGPVTLIGSSLGGYVSALFAARHPEVERLVLLAPAFGFAKLWHGALGEAAMNEWRHTGWRTFYHYGEGRECPVSYGLIEDASAYEDYPEVACPSLILHGLADDVVPLSASERFAASTPGARLIALQSGHELTDVTSDLWAETARFLNL